VSELHLRAKVWALNSEFDAGGTLELSFAGAAFRLALPCVHRRHASTAVGQRRERERELLLSLSLQSSEIRGRDSNTTLCIMSKKKCVLIYFNLLQPKLLTTFHCKVSSNISSPTRPTKIVSQEAKVSHTNTGMEFSVWVEPQRPNVTQLRSKSSVITPP